jgi:ribosomal protein L37AE/L43A
MWVKELSIPIHALQGEALLRRLPNNHPKRPEIEKDVRMLMKGYYGEKNFSHYLSFLPEEKYYIFQGLRLSDKKEFQMDTLILSQNFILIAEVKNINGTIKINKDTKQMTREYENNVDGLQNPILQVERHETQFKNWLLKRKIPKIPIETLAIISKTTTIVDTTDGDPEVYKKLLYAESFLPKIKELENKYTTPVMSKNKLLPLTQLLLNSHINHFLDIQHKYGISRSEIKNRGQCPICKSFEVNYISANWCCSSCKFQSKTSYIPALTDYSLLINQAITRKECKEFLQIKSHQAKYLLSSMNLPSIGSKRGTVYILSPLLENHIEKRGNLK